MNTEHYQMYLASTDIHNTSLGMIAGSRLLTVYQFKHFINLFIFFIEI